MEGERKPQHGAKDGRSPKRNGSSMVFFKKSSSPRRHDGESRKNLTRKKVPEVSGGGGTPFQLGGLFHLLASRTPDGKGKSQRKQEKGRRWRGTEDGTTTGKIPFKISSIRKSGMEGKKIHGKRGLTSKGLCAGGTPPPTPPKKKIHPNRDSMKALSFRLSKGLL